MSFWLGLSSFFGIILFFAYRGWARRKAERTADDEQLQFEVKIESRLITSVESGPSKPDNPRFATWEEAMNRPITDDLRFLIEYQDANGVVTEREIRPLRIELKANRPEVTIVAHCYLRNEERPFRSERILKTLNRQTGRKLNDLGQYLRARY